MLQWFKEISDDQDVIISSRVRLARNISEFPFVNRMTDQEKNLLVSNIKNVISSLNLEGSSKLQIMDMKLLSKNQRNSLVEQHLISPQFAQDTTGKVLFLSEDSGLSIMINEEDHIRIQALKSGMNLEKALEKANFIDDQLDQHINYCFSDKLGFLTQCPTNLGTGLRASVMLHLPLLESNGFIPQIANNIVKLGLILRGTYGEGTAPLGSFYQISNQVTLGISEENAIKNLESIVNHIVSQERSLRECAKGNNLEDRVWRAYGILKNARVMSFSEFMNMVSLVRLGIDVGYINDISYELLNELILFQGSAYLAVLENKDLSEAECNYIRSKIIREKIEQER